MKVKEAYIIVETDSSEKLIKFLDPILAIGRFIEKNFLSVFDSCR